MSKLVLNGDTSGSVTLDAPAVSGTTTLTLPTTTGTLVVTSGAQTIEFADGSASAPSITNSGNTNTGIFFSTADTIDFAEGGVACGQFDSSANFKFNSGYGSVATAYGCRAWVNFDGTSNTANLTGTYSQSGTTVTVTVTNHGLIAGNVIFADATTGTAVDGTYTVATVTSANVFTYTAGTSLTTSGNMTLRRNTIRGSGNVTSITDNGTGDYTVNFTTAMPDVNYAPFTSARSYQDNDDNGIFTFPFLNHTNTTSAFRFIVAYKDAGSSSGNTPFDSTQVNVSVFR